ncbi:unnamed protein product [Lampetra fluviatilis]
MTRSVKALKSSAVHGSSRRRRPVAGKRGTVCPSPQTQACVLGLVEVAPPLAEVHSAADDTCCVMRRFGHRLRDLLLLTPVDESPPLALSAWQLLMMFAVVRSTSGAACSPEMTR